MRRTRRTRCGWRARRWLTAWTVGRTVHTRGVGSGWSVRWSSTSRGCATGARRSGSLPGCRWAGSAARHDCVSPGASGSGGGPRLTWRRCRSWSGICFRTTRSARVCATGGTTPWLRLLGGISMWRRARGAARRGTRWPSSKRTRRSRPRSPGPRRGRPGRSCGRRWTGWTRTASARRLRPTWQ